MTNAKDVGINYRIGLGSGGVAMIAIVVVFLPSKDGFEQ